MVCILLAIGAVGAGILLCICCLFGRHRHDEHKVYVHAAFPGRGSQPQAEFQRGPREEGEVVPVNYRAPRKLERFIQNQVIPNLNLQRNDRSKDQFAAVILSDKDLDQIDELQLYANNGQLVDSNECSHPDSSNLVNYIVARPDHDILGNRRTTRHAEGVLLDRFNELWRNFGRRPFLILIFSWLMPCSECTEAIINRLGYLCAQHQVIIVFRSNYTPQVNEENRKRLTAANFRVYHVSYTENLPRN